MFCTQISSLVRYGSRWAGKERAWYPLFAHVLNLPEILVNLGKLETIVLCLHYVDIITYTTVVMLRIQRLSNYGVQLRQRSLVCPQAAEYPEYDSQGGTGSLHFGCLQWQRHFFVATNRVWKICVLRGVTLILL